MNVLDWILLVIRWGHALSAVAWVGGGMFYVLVLSPARRRASLPEDTGRAIGDEFRGLVNTAMAVLLVTGIVLAASRLTAVTVTIPYVAVLALKIALALYMFYVVRFLRRQAYPEERLTADSWWAKMRGKITSTAAVLVIGVVVFGLSDLLDLLFEKALTP